MLGDSPERDYSKKLHTFGEFAAPELRRIINDLRLEEESVVLDVGCGTGLGTQLLRAHAARVIGVDLSLPHVRATARSEGGAGFVVADARRLPFPDHSFDVVWACNSLNHLSNPERALRDLWLSLRPAGRLVVAQSHLLPEMFFAWDYHLDARVRSACHEYYRAKYGLTTSDTASSTRLLGIVREAGFTEVRPKTYVLERFAPLSEGDVEYLLRLYEAYWGEKLRPFLSEEDWRRLQHLCDPESEEFSLTRNDFHYLQTLSVVEGRRPEA